MNQDRVLAQKIARAVAGRGGQVFYVGGCVRDEMMGIESKDIDLEVYYISPGALREVLSSLGEVVEKGASFGVLGLRHSDLDIAMPRTERRTGEGHRDFDVSVDPWLSVREATRRRDFTINAMMRDVLTGVLVDEWGGRDDLDRRLIRHVSADTFIEDALRVFRAAQFAARLNAQVHPDTVELCRSIDVSALTRERVFEEMNKALLKAERPSVFFRVLRQMNQLSVFFPEIEALSAVPQNPVWHPEGDVFEHTMLVLDAAAELRARAVQPLNFMISALVHDLGKLVATKIDENGKISSPGHEVLGEETVRRQLERLTNNRDLIAYAVNLTKLHMRPNMLAAAHSKKCKTRMMFDICVCPEDLILLSRADATGKLDQSYDPAWEAFLTERLADYKKRCAQPMVTGADLIAAGVRPGPRMGEMLRRARRLHFAGLEKKQALRQLLREFAPGADESAY